jgi:dephospho-CoA kinase
MLIGLTGGYCAGKNTVAALLTARGWTCIDADKLGREAIETPEAKRAIVARFGNSVLRSDGSIDRKSIARIVFSDPKALADQEAIVHPIAVALMNERIAEAERAARESGTEPRVCVNAALLHRAEVIDKLDAVIEVRAPLILRVLRGIRRDGEGLDGALRRIARQSGFRRRLQVEAKAAGLRVFRLCNLGSPASLEGALDRILSVLR